jgi:hypothetical protein
MAGEQGGMGDLANMFGGGGAPQPPKEDKPEVAGDPVKFYITGKDKNGKLQTIVLADVSADAAFGGIPVTQRPYEDTPARAIYRYMGENLGLNLGSRAHPEISCVAENLTAEKREEIYRVTLAEAEFQSVLGQLAARTQDELPKDMAGKAFVLCEDDGDGYKAERVINPGKPKSSGKTVVSARELPGKMNERLQGEKKDTVKDGLNRAMLEAVTDESNAVTSLEAEGENLKVSRSDEPVKPVDYRSLGRRKWDAKQALAREEYYRQKLEGNGTPAQLEKRAQLREERRARLEARFGVITKDSPSGDHLDSVREAVEAQKDMLERQIDHGSARRLGTSHSKSARAAMYAERYQGRADILQARAPGAVLLEGKSDFVERAEVLGRDIKHGTVFTPTATGRKKREEREGPYAKRRAAFKAGEAKRAQSKRGLEGKREEIEDPKHERAAKARLGVLRGADAVVEGTHVAGLGATTAAALAHVPLPLAGVGMAAAAGSVLSVGAFALGPLGALAAVARYDAHKQKKRRQLAEDAYRDVAGVEYHETSFDHLDAFTAARNKIVAEEGDQSILDHRAEELLGQYDVKRNDFRGLDAAQRAAHKAAFVEKQVAAKPSADEKPGVVEDSIQDETKLDSLDYLDGAEALDTALKEFMAKQKAQDIARWKEVAQAEVDEARDLGRPLEAVEFNFQDAELDQTAAFNGGVSEYRKGAGPDEEKLSALWDRHVSRVCAGRYEEILRLYKAYIGTPGNDKKNFQEFLSDQTIENENNDPLHDANTKQLIPVFAGFPAEAVDAYFTAQSARDLARWKRGDYRQFNDDVDQDMSDIDALDQADLPKGPAAWRASHLDHAQARFRAMREAVHAPAGAFKGDFSAYQKEKADAYKAARNAAVTAHAKANYELFYNLSHATSVEQVDPKIARKLYRGDHQEALHAAKRRVVLEAYDYDYAMTSADVYVASKYEQFQSDLKAGIVHVDGFQAQDDDHCDAPDHLAGLFFYDDIDEEAALKQYLEERKKAFLDKQLSSENVEKARDDYELDRRRFNKGRDVKKHRGPFDLAKYEKEKVLDWENGTEEDKANNEGSFRALYVKQFDANKTNAWYLQNQKEKDIRRWMGRGPSSQGYFDAQGDFQAQDRNLPARANYVNDILYREALSTYWDENHKATAEERYENFKRAYQASGESFSDFQKARLADWGADARFERQYEGLKALADNQDASAFQGVFAEERLFDPMRQLTASDFDDVGDKNRVGVAQRDDDVEYWALNGISYQDANGERQILNLDYPVTVLGNEYKDQAELLAAGDVVLKEFWNARVYPLDATQQNISRVNANNVINPYQKADIERWKTGKFTYFDRHGNEVAIEIEFPVTLGGDQYTDLQALRAADDGKLELLWNEKVRVKPSALQYIYKQNVIASLNRNTQGLLARPNYQPKQSLEDYQAAQREVFLAQAGDDLAGQGISFLDEELEVRKLEITQVAGGPFPKFMLDARRETDVAVWMAVGQDAEVHIFGDKPIKRKDLGPAGLTKEQLEKVWDQKVSQNYVAAVRLEARAEAQRASDVATWMAAAPDAVVFTLGGKDVKREDLGPADLTKEKLETIWGERLAAVYIASIRGDVGEPRDVNIWKAHLWEHYLKEHATIRHEQFSALMDDDVLPDAFLRSRGVSEADIAARHHAMSAVEDDIDARAEKAMLREMAVTHESDADLLASKDRVIKERADALQSQLDEDLSYVRHATYRPDDLTSVKPADGFAGLTEMQKAYVDLKGLAYLRAHPEARSARPSAEVLNAFQKALNNVPAFAAASLAGQRNALESETCRELAARFPEAYANEAAVKAELDQVRDDDFARVKDEWEDPAALVVVSVEHTFPDGSKAELPITDRQADGTRTVTDEEVRAKYDKEHADDFLIKWADQVPAACQKAATQSWESDYKQFEAAKAERIKRVEEADEEQNRILSNKETYENYLDSVKRAAFFADAMAYQRKDDGERDANYVYWKRNESGELDGLVEDYYKASAHRKAAEGFFEYLESRDHEEFVLAFELIALLFDTEMFNDKTPEGKAARILKDPAKVSAIIDGLKGSATKDPETGEVMVNLDTFDPRGSGAVNASPEQQQAYKIAAAVIAKHFSLTVKGEFTKDTAAQGVVDNISKRMERRRALKFAETHQVKYQENLAGRPAEQSTQGKQSEAAKTLQQFGHRG